mmetsp:Transcript_35217/g.74299  ORF Transcript_35217/g.74299 Transcript_35217/m.74299 type:complete len:285 (+) Transcript_35217:2367-3221(+)
MRSGVPGECGRIVGKRGDRRLPRTRQYFFSRSRRHRQCQVEIDVSADVIRRPKPWQTRSDPSRRGAVRRVSAPVAAVGRRQDHRSVVPGHGRESAAASATGPIVGSAWMTAVVPPPPAEGVGQGSSSRHSSASDDDLQGVSDGQAKDGLDVSASRTFAEFEDASVLLVFFGEGQFGLAPASIAAPSPTTPDLHPDFLPIGPPVFIPRDHVRLNDIILREILRAKFQRRHVDRFESRGVSRDMNVGHENNGSIVPGVLRPAPPGGGMEVIGIGRVGGRAAALLMP